MAERAGPGAAARLAVGFVHALRREGVPVTVDSSITYVRALSEVAVDDEQQVYWTGRATLVHREEHRPPYDRVYDAYWRGRASHAPGDVEAPAPPEPQAVMLSVDDAADEPVDSGPHRVDAKAPSAVLRYSAVEVLRHRDLATCTPDELRDTYRLIAKLRLGGPARRSRRHRPTAAPRARTRHDMRRTVRESLRTDGELLSLLRKSATTRHRRVVLLLDVSGSMEPYARALLRFAHAAVAARRSIEAFALGTRMTRLTRQLTTRDPNQALAAAAQAVEDWAGGTRLGAGLRRFNDEWGTRGMARGAVVVILSDGWDRGDPDELSEQMRRLSLVAHRVVWVNPLKASEGYAPLAQGMAAALPYVDEFIEGHSVAALEHLVQVVAS